jgi:hypothetical protein
MVRNKGKACGRRTAAFRAEFRRGQVTGELVLAVILLVVNSGLLVKASISGPPAFLWFEAGIVPMLLVVVVADSYRYLRAGREGP